MPTPADFQAMRDAYGAVAPAPAHFDEFAAKTSTMVHEFPGWTDELRSLQVPTLLIFGDRDFSPLPDVVEVFELLPNAQLAVLPGDHARRRDTAARRSVRVDHAIPRRALSGGYLHPVCGAESGHAASSSPEGRGRRPIPRSWNLLRRRSEARSERPVRLGGSRARRPGVAFRVEGRDLHAGVLCVPGMSWGPAARQA
jgi:hypothetical protein